MNHRKVAADHADLEALDPYEIADELAHEAHAICQRTGAGRLRLIYRRSTSKAEGSVSWAMVDAEIPAKWESAQETPVAAGFRTLEQLMGEILPVIRTLPILRP